MIARSPHAILTVLALAIALAVGWLGLRYSTAIDVTANQRHGLTAGTRAALTDFDGPIDILAVLPPQPGTRRAVEALVQQYRDLKPDIALTFLNPDTDPARARALGAAPGGELILTAAGREQRLQRLDERSLTGAIRKLGREGTRQLAFVTGHGERSPQAIGNDDWSIVAERLAAIGFQARDYSFVTEPVVPDEIDVLVIAAPQSPFFPGEIASVMRYVANGGNLLWLIETPTAYPAATESADASTPSLGSAVASGPGLSALASELGIVTEPGRVIDTASQALNAEAPDFVLLGAHPAHPITAGLAAPLLLPQARALAVTPLAGQTTLPLLVTPESSWTETGELAGEVRFDADTDEVSGPLILGVTLERRIGAQMQRIAVLGDADLGSSQFVGNGGNAAFVEQLFTWLSGDDDALAFTTTPAPDGTLELGRRAIVVLSVVCLIGLPMLLLCVAGAVRVAMRR